MDNEFYRSQRKPDVNDAEASLKQRIADLHLCSVHESGRISYLAGEVLPGMRGAAKGIAHEVEQLLTDAFRNARIDISGLGRMPIHLAGDHRGNTESWRLECTNGWGAAANRLLEKTRAAQREGAWVDL